MSGRIAAIVLAAGASSRFGDSNKLLARVEGAPLVTHAVDAAIAGGAGQVLVVTGHDADAVRRALGRRPVTFVHNAEPERGMGRSLAIGAAALDPDAIDGVLVLLADMPGIRATDVRALCDAFDPRDPTAIVAPVFAGRRGHPVLFGAAHLAALRALDGDRGARGILDARSDAVLELPAPDDRVLRDVDHPADAVREP